MRLYELALKNLRRRPTAAAIAVLAAACTVAVSLAYGLIGAGLAREDELARARRGPDLTAVPDDFSGTLAHALASGEAASVFFDASMTGLIAAYPFVARVSPILFVAPLGPDQGCANPLCSIIAFDPATDFTVLPWLPDGRSLDLAPTDALSGSVLSFATGDTVTLLGQSCRIAARLEPSGSWLDRALFIPFSEQIPANRVTAVMIQLKPPDRGGVLPSEASYRLNKDIYELKVSEPGGPGPGLRPTTTPWTSAFPAAALTLWPGAMIIIGFTSALAASRRRRELALLRGLGATRFQVLALLVGETAVSASAGALAGTLAAFAFLAALAVPVPSPIASARIALLTLVLAVAAASASAALPAFLASRRDPGQVLRSD